MRRQIYGVVTLFVVLSGMQASAAVFKLPLKDLVGVYSDDGSVAPRTKSISYDFGQEFSRIDDIRIHVTGTLAPGSWQCWDELYRPIAVAWNPQPNFHLYPANNGTPDEIIKLGQIIEGLGPVPNSGGVFDGEVGFFSPSVPPAIGAIDWDLFKSGRGSLDLDLVWTVPMGTQVVPGIVAFSDASLIIEGEAVPEPTSMGLLIVASSIGLLSRRRRS